MEDANKAVAAKRSQIATLNGELDALVGRLAELNSTVLAKSRRSWRFRRAWPRSSRS